MVAEDKMPIIDGKGLFRGKRLRKLKAQSHLLWPFVFQSFQ
jgi:hypothetical protein